MKRRLRTDAGYLDKNGHVIQNQGGVDINNSSYNGVRDMIARASVYRYGAKSNEVQNVESKISSIVLKSKGKLSSGDIEGINSMVEQFNPALHIGKDANNYGYKQIFNSPDLSEYTQWYSGAYNKLTQIWENVSKFN
jgi:hypothetical protein